MLSLDTQAKFHTRGGVLSVRLTGTDQVTLIGQAVTVLSGELRA